MAESPPPPQSDSLWKNPQIVAALITAVATLVVALISFLPRSEPAPTPVPVAIVTATPTPNNTPSTAPSAEVAVQASATIEIISPSATPVPTSTVPPTSTTAPAANILLMYDEVSFTLLNQSGGTLSLEGVVFRSAVGEWNAQQWGTSLYTSLPTAMCLRIRDSAVGQRQPPRPCVDRIYGLIEISGSSLFWIGVEQFDVLKNEALLTSCRTADESCVLYIP